MRFPAFPRFFRPRFYVVLTINGFPVPLNPYWKVHMSTIVTVGHSLALAIEYFDQNGNPMLTPPTPEAPPSWSDTNPAAETLTVAPSGLSATAMAIAPGTDTINLSITAGGKNFAASLSVEVDAAPQVLTSIGISATVS